MSPSRAARSSVVDFLGLRPAGDDRWTAEVEPHLVTGRRGNLFGGVGLALGVATLEAATERPAIWATVQFVGSVRRGATLAFVATRPAVGHRITQARVRAVDGDEAEPSPVDEAGRPEDAELVVRGYDHDNIHARTEVRMARGLFGFTGTGQRTDDRRTLQWARMPGVALTAPSVALLADYLSSAVGNALGRVADVTSLDNTIRFHEPVGALGLGDRWVLIDGVVDAVTNGSASASAHLWTRDGRLLATASQTMTVRRPR